MKNVLVISTGPREGGNSDLLAAEFVRGALEAGNKAEKIDLYDKDIGFCRGCLTCQETRRCEVRDDAIGVMDKMMEADVIAFATPIYFYEMCGQMKTLLDRTNWIPDDEYKFRDIYLLASSGSPKDNAVEGAVKGLSGWVHCYKKTQLCAVIHAGGVDEKGEVNGTEAMRQTFEAGKNV